MTRRGDPRRGDAEPGGASDEPYPSAIDDTDRGAGRDAALGSAGFCLAMVLWTVAATLLAGGCFVWTWVGNAN